VRVLVVSVAAAALALAVPATAAQAPTILVMPTVLGRVATPIVFQGTVPGAGAGVEVKIEARGCGETFYRLYGLTHTIAGGGWRWEPTGSGAYIRTNTAFRARANGELSRTVMMRRRVGVGLQRERGRTFRVGIFSEFVNLHGKRVRIERYAGGRWVLMRQSPKLVRESYGTHSAMFVVRRSGLQLRAVVPESLVKRCYAAGVSEILTS
jgi:hypothetical protein